MASPNGRISGAKCPEVLTLVTFIEAAPWRQITREDREFPLFEWPWREQDAWTVEQHRDFWRASIGLWPRKAGQRLTTEILSTWVWALRRDGFSDTAAAAELGYEFDSLRRRGVFRGADRYAADYDRTITGLRDETLSLRPPMVWAPEIDDELPVQASPIPCSIAFEALSDDDRRVRDYYKELAGW